MLSVTSVPQFMCMDKELFQTRRYLPNPMLGSDGHYLPFDDIFKSQLPNGQAFTSSIEASEVALLHSC